jgi:hypothetical protein
MQRSNEPDGCRDCADRSSVHTDTRSVEIHALKPANETERVKTRQTDSKSRNSPNTPEIETLECTRRWKKVSPDGINVYIPWNMPVKALGTISRRIVFGRAGGAEERVAASVEGERVGNGVGNRDEQRGDADGTTNGGSVDSKRVKTALLAAGSQLTYYRSRIQGYNSPVLPCTSIQPADRLYGPIRRCGTPTIERINDKKVSKPQTNETAHLEHARAAQPPVQPADRPYGPARPRHRRGTLEIERTNDKNISPTRNGETAYLRRDPIAQPRGDDPQRSYRVIGPRRRHGRLKTRPTNISQTETSGNAYQGLYKPILPLPLDPSDPTRSTSIGGLLYGLQSSKKNLQNVSGEDSKSIASSTHLSVNGSTTRNAFIANT